MPLHVDFVLCGDGGGGGGCCRCAHCVHVHLCLFPLVFVIFTIMINDNCNNNCKNAYN